jgi:septum formation protein
VKLVLASTSPYRRELLARLRLPFEVASPGTDEKRLPGEAPEQLARRLALEKARAVATRHADALIIGSDQVAVCEGEILGKPGNHERAVEQLRRLSGREAVFHTAVCLLDAGRGEAGLRVVPYHVKFRRLDEQGIERYLSVDQPYDCAASAKAESLGIALLEYMRGDDPTALIGLPLIAVVSLLQEAGVRVP